MHITSDKKLIVSAYEGSIDYEDEDEWDDDNHGVADYSSLTDILLTQSDIREVRKQLTILLRQMEKEHGVDEG